MRESGRRRERAIGGGEIFKHKREGGSEREREFKGEKGGSLREERG